MDPKARRLLQDSDRRWNRVGRDIHHLDGRGSRAAPRVHRDQCTGRAQPGCLVQAGDSDFSLAPDPLRCRARAVGGVALCGARIGVDDTAPDRQVQGRRVTARRALPLRNRLALLAADRGRTLSYVRQMAMQAHVVALDRAVPLSEARAIAAELATHPDVEYAQRGPPAQADVRSQRPVHQPADVSRQRLRRNQRLCRLGHHDREPQRRGRRGRYRLPAARGACRPIYSGIRLHLHRLRCQRWRRTRSDASDPGDWVTQADIDGPLRGEDCSVDDSSWHGTAVSAVIGANGNDHA